MDQFLDTRIHTSSLYLLFQQEGKTNNIWVVGATQSTNVCLPLPVLKSEVKRQHSFYMGNQNAPARSSHLPSSSIPPASPELKKRQLCWSGCPPLLYAVLPSYLTCLLSTTVVIPPCSTSTLSTGTAIGTGKVVVLGWKERCCCFCWMGRKGSSY